MSKALDELDRLTIEAKARARRRHRIEQESFERAVPRGVTICPTCGAAVPHYVAHYGCSECGAGAGCGEGNEKTRVNE